MESASFFFRSFLLQLAFLVFILTVSTPVNGCSCPVDSFRRSRTSAIKDEFCDSFIRDVYIGTVIAATCNCIPEGMQTMTDTSYNQFLNCQRYQWDPDSGQSVISSSIIARGGCVDRYESYSISNCSSVGMSLVSGGLRLDEQQQTDLPGLIINNTDTSGVYTTCNYTCPFNSMLMDGERYYVIYRTQPCLYAVRVDEVFKGNYSSGEVVEESGPDVQTTCAAYGRVLEIGASYVVGIGHVCSPISRWAKTSSYSDGELQLLRDFSEDVTCGEMTLIPSLTLFLFIVLTTLLFYN